MATREPGRSLWSVLAGALLLGEGVVALLLGLTTLFMSLFPPVAAIQGRASIDQTMFGPAFGLLAIAVACFWAALVSFRGRRPGRLIGAVLTVALIVLAASLFLVDNPSLSGEPVLFLMLAAVPIVIIVASIRRPARMIPEGS